MSEVNSFTVYDFLPDSTADLMGCLRTYREVSFGGWRERNGKSRKIRKSYREKEEKEEKKVIIMIREINITLISN